MSSRADQAPPASVVAAVLTGRGAPVADTVAAIERQAYEARRIVLVGGEDTRDPGEDGNGWAPTLDSLLEDLGADVTHLWILRVGAVPRPDALRALVDDF